MYCNKFFKTEDEAKAFQKSHGGALYKNVKSGVAPGNRTGWKPQWLCRAAGCTALIWMHTRTAWHGMANR